MDGHEQESAGSWMSVAAAENASGNILGEGDRLKIGNYGELLPRSASEDEPQMEVNVSDNLVPSSVVEEELVDEQAEAAAQTLQKLWRPPK